MKDDMKPFTLGGRVRSFGYAFEGLGVMLKGQHNAWIHLSATVAVILAATCLQVRAEDWRWLVVATALVWVAEAFNTAIEHVCDVVSPDYSLAVKRAKDIAAGAVLIGALAAVAIGGITLWPYIDRMLAAIHGPISI